MNIPMAEQEVKLKTAMIPSMIKEALEYCAFEAVEHYNDIGSLHYDHVTDELTYHLVLAPFDRNLFSWLQDVTEIWIITKGGVES